MQAWATGTDWKPNNQNHWQFSCEVDPEGGLTTGMHTETCWKMLLMLATADADKNSKTRRILKSWACGSWFTNSSHVLPTPRVVYQPINHRNLWSIALVVCVSYISLVFSNACCVLSQRNTWLRLLYMLKIKWQ